MATETQKYKVIGKAIGQNGKLFDFETLDDDSVSEVSNISRCSTLCLSGATTVLPISPGDIVAIFSPTPCVVFFDSTVSVPMRGFLIIDKAFVTDIRIIVAGGFPDVRVDAVSLEL